MSKLYIEIIIALPSSQSMYFLMLLPETHKLVVNNAKIHIELNSGEVKGGFFKLDLNINLN